MNYNPIWHIHGDGSIPAEKLFDLAKKQAKKKGEELLKPAVDANNNKIAYISDEERLVKNLDDLKSVIYDLSKYGFSGAFGYATGAMQDEEGIREGIKLYFDYLKSHKITHAETHYAPQLHTFEGLNLDDVLEIMADSFKNEMNRTRINAGIISAIARHCETEDGLEVAKATLRAHEKYPDVVIALGLACDETKYPPRRHYSAFQRTFGTTLKRDVHAGEQLLNDQNDLANIREAFYLLRAQSIDHAIPVHCDPAVANEVIETKVRIASNPLSNKYFFGIPEKRVNLNKAVAMRLLIGHNPDDPCMMEKKGKPFGHQTDVEDYIRSCYQGRWGETLITKLRHNLVLGSWLISDQEKKYYYEKNRHEIMVRPHTF